MLMQRARPDHIYEIYIGSRRAALQEFEHQIQLLSGRPQRGDHIDLCPRFRRKFIKRIVAQLQACFET